MQDISVRISLSMYFVSGLLFLFGSGVYAGTLPPDPTNAALLYYQAFLLRPESDYATNELVYNTRIENFIKLLNSGKLKFGTDTEDKVREYKEKLKNFDSEPNQVKSGLDVMMDPHTNSKMSIYEKLHFLYERREYEREMNGVDPNETIRKYIKKCQGTIKLAQAASELYECDWGFRYSEGLTNNIVPQLAEIRNLGTILDTDALLLAADGDFRAAFEHCLMIRRFARHVGNDTTLLFTTSNTLSGQAIRCIRVVLGCMKPDEGILMWLKNRLEDETDLPLSFTKTLKMEMEIALQKLRTDKKALMKVREEFTRELDNHSVGKKINDLTDEELISHVEKRYVDFLSSIFHVLDANKSYTQKYAEIRSLAGELDKKYENYWLTHNILMRWSGVVPGLYTHYMLHKAHFHALMAGIDIYLVRAKTGKLPEALPEGLRTDPFTGKDFLYEITKDGFRLTSPDKDIPKQRQYSYEFRIKR